MAKSVVIILTVSHSCTARRVFIGLGRLNAHLTVKRVIVAKRTTTAVRRTTVGLRLNSTKRIVRRHALRCGPERSAQYSGGTWKDRNQLCRTTIRMESSAIRVWELSRAIQMIGVYAFKPLNTNLMENYLSLPTNAILKTSKRSVKFISRKQKPTMTRRSSLKTSVGVLLTETTVFVVQW